MSTKRMVLIYLCPILLFSLVHAGITVISNNLVNVPGELGSDVSWTTSAAYFNYIVAGYLSGWLSRSRHFLNGLIAGALSSLVAVFFFGVGSTESFYINFVFCVTGSVLGGLGAVLSKMRAIGKKNAL